MQSFSDFINFWAVADVLVAKRVQLGDKLHKKHMLHLMSPSQRLGEVMKTDLTLLQLMPSRKHWVGQGKKTKIGKGIKRYKSLCIK